jgi:hypothetical protein
MQARMYETTFLFSDLLIVGPIPPFLKKGTQYHHNNKYLDLKSIEIRHKSKLLCSKDMDSIRVRVVRNKYKKVNMSPQKNFEVVLPVSRACDYKYFRLEGKSPDLTVN